MARIFISYRRSDSQAITDRIYERLERTFGSKNVFKDVDDIGPGEHFPELVRKKIAECDVMLVIVGRTWATVIDEHGYLRLENPHDFVRTEVEAGLRKLAMLGHPRMRVIPVLVNDAEMPSQRSLPYSLSLLVELNAYKVRNDPDFHHDIERLIRKIKETSKRQSTNHSWRYIVGIFVFISVFVCILPILYAVFNEDIPFFPQHSSPTRTEVTIIAASTPTETSLPAPSSTLVPSVTLSPTLESSATPSLTPSPSDTLEPSVILQPTLTETATFTPTSPATETPTLTPTHVPTPTGVVAEIVTNTPDPFGEIDPDRLGRAWQAVIADAPLEEIAEELRQLGLMTGQLDPNQALVLVSDNSAWVLVEYAHNYVLENVLSEETLFQHFTLRVTMTITTDQPGGFCGIRTNYDRDSASFFDLLLYKDGHIEITGYKDGWVIFSLPVYPSGGVDLTDLTSIALKAVITFDPVEGLTMQFQPLTTRLVDAGTEFPFVHPGLLHPDLPFGLTKLRAGTPNEGHEVYCSFSDFEQVALE